MFGNNQCPLRLSTSLVYQFQVLSPAFLPTYFSIGQALYLGYKQMVDHFYTNQEGY